MVTNMTKMETLYLLSRSCLFFLIKMNSLLYIHSFVILLTDLTFSLYFGNRLLTNQTTLQLSDGDDVIIDCKTQSNIRELHLNTQNGFGWFKIEDGGIR